MPLMPTARSGQQSQLNAHTHNAQQARKILQSKGREQLQAQARERLQAKAQAQAIQAPRQNPVAQCATPESGDVNAFLKEALATALQGNEELRVSGQGGCFKN